MVAFSHQYTLTPVIGSRSSRTTDAHSPLRTLPLRLLSFIRGLLSLELSPLAMGVSFHQPWCDFRRSSRTCAPALTLHAFIKRRKVLVDLIATSSSLTYASYWRLMILATTDFIFTIPLATWAIIENAIEPVQPFSWADVHSGYSQIPQYPRASVSQLVVCGWEVTRWGAILCAFAFFGFFGLSNEARRNYRLLASAIAKYLRITAFAEGKATPDPHGSSTLYFASAPASFQFTTQSSTLHSSSNVFPPIEKVVQILDAAELDHASVKRASTPVAPIPILVDQSEKV